jgi:hypothetical protein
VALEVEVVVALLVKLLVALEHQDKVLLVVQEYFLLQIMVLAVVVEAGQLA